MKLRLSILSTALLSLSLSAAMAQNSDLGFENITLWKGLTADTTNVKEGKQSGRWEDTVTVDRIISKKGFPKDVSMYEGMKFWVYSDGPTEAKIAVVLFSENEETEDADYYLQSFAVDWTGWKQIDIPFSKLREIREPAGFTNIREVRFVSEGYTIGKPSPDTHLNFDGMELYGPGSKSSSPAETMPQMNSVDTSNLKWENTINDAIATARSQGKLVFVVASEKNSSNFSEIENLCASGMANEELKHFSLYRFDPKDDNNSRQFFKIIKLPTLLVFNASGEELLRLTEIPSSEDFVKQLREVKENNPVM